MNNIIDQNENAIQQRWNMLDDNPFLLYMANLGESSRKPQGHALTVIARLFEVDDPVDFHWHELTVGDIATIRLWLSTNYKFSTANRYLSAIRGVLKECWRLKLLTYENFQVLADIKSFKYEYVKTGRIITDEEFCDMMNVCGYDTIGNRDAVMLYILGNTGIRCKEAVNLKIDDFSSANSTLKVMGKGNKERNVPVSTILNGILTLWIKKLPNKWIYPKMKSSNGKLVILNEPVSTGALSKRVQRCAKLAGLDKITPHDFRHTFITELLSAGVDLLTVQKIVGHKSPNTTSIYDNRDYADMLKAVELLSNK